MQEKQDKPQYMKLRNAVMNAQEERMYTKCEEEISNQQQPESDWGMQVPAGSRGDATGHMVKHKHAVLVLG